MRKEQDLGKQINAQLGALNNAAVVECAADEKVVKATNAAIDKLRADRDKVRQEINKRFPSYADLIDPKPPTVEQIKATLRRARRCCRSISAGRDSFVWAVPKDGPVAFAAIKASRWRYREQGAQAARGARAAGGDDLRHSAVRPRRSATSSIRCCSSRSKPAGSRRRA